MRAWVRLAMHLRLRRDSHSAVLTLRRVVPSFSRHIFVCVNERPPEHPKGCCKAKSGAEVRDEFKKQLAARGLAATVRANNAGCLDQCAQGVAVVVYPEQVWYGNVTVADVRELVERHIVNGEAVERLMLPEQAHLENRRSFGKLR
jgi:(2Fe-2S) ferredoxin